MKTIDKVDLKKAQLIMLDILVEVDKICNKHKIKYWLDSGTLLGAVRHKGFIPWDDDLDITMTIEDYYKFCEIAPHELPKHMFLQTEKTDNYFPYDFAKVRNSKGKIIEKHEIGKNVKYNQNIFIDIFPVIAIKNNLTYKYFYKVNFLIIKLFSYKYLNIRFVRKFFISIIDNLNNGWNNESLKVIRSGRMPEFEFYMDIKTIFSLKKMMFEGREFYVPNNSEEYLRILYGNDYMNLPPENKRHTHAYSISVNKDN